jgi:hypothetical protein
MELSLLHLAPRGEFDQEVNEPRIEHRLFSGGFAAGFRYTCCVISMSRWASRGAAVF